MAVGLFRRLRSLASLLSDAGLPPASSVTYDHADSGLEATNVKAALDELADLGGGGPGSDDQTAAEVPFTPAGTIAATNVQAAIEEVAAEATGGSVTPAAYVSPAFGTVADLVESLIAANLMDGPPENDFIATLLAMGPKLYWPYADTGGTAADVSGNALTGTVGSGVTVGQAGLLNGEGTPGSFLFTPPHDGVAVADDPDLDLGDSLTIVMVIRAATVGANRTLAIKGGGAYYLRADNNNLQLLSAGVAVICTSVGDPIDVDTTYLVIVAKDGATVVMEVNHTDVTGAVTDSTLTNNTEGFGVGSSEGDWDGLIAHVALFDRALDGTERTSLFTASGIIT